MENETNLFHSIPYDSKVERVGAIRDDSTILEFVNMSDKPESSFLISGRDAMRLTCPDIVATWHTHPTEYVNASTEDYASFLAFPWLKHYIKGEKQVVVYKVTDGKVIKEKVVDL